MKTRLLIPIVMVGMILETFTFMLSAFGQNNSAIDSLENILDTVIADTTKLKCLNELRDQYGRITEYEMAIQYAESAIELATNLNYKQEIAQNHQKIGFFYAMLHNYPEALHHFSAALVIFDEIADTTGISNSYNNIGYIYTCLLYTSDAADECVNV